MGQDKKRVEQENYKKCYNETLVLCNIRKERKREKERSRIRQEGKQTRKSMKKLKGK